MAPVIRTLRTTPAISVRMLCSGQHRELLAPLIDWFELAVDSDLKVMTDNQSLTTLTERLIHGFEKSLSNSRPDLVLAQGDTTTVMCAALVSFYMHIPFGHIEAGLRTHDVHNPFPEEFNRVAVTRLSQLHFCPTENSHTNILAEHVAPSSAHLTGNTVIDALQFTIGKIKNRQPRDQDHDILVTAHRRENFGAPLIEICKALLDLCDEFSNLKILYPVHPNPNVKEIAHRLLGNHPRIMLTPPLDYPDLVAAMQQSRLILTDSGGIQEEAPALGRPVLVLRHVTERPEAVQLGVAKMVGPIRSVIVTETGRLLREADHYARMSCGGSPYGDGHAAEKIRDHVCHFLNI